MGSANWFYIDGSGRTVGPVSLDTMKDLSRVEVIKPNTLVKLEEASEWQRSVDSHEFRIQIVPGKKRLPSTGTTRAKGSTRAKGGATAKGSAAAKGGTGNVQEKPKRLQRSVPISELMARWETAKEAKTPKAPITSDPSSDRQQTAPVSSGGESQKQCRMCSEWILSSAKKCRYCHSNLVDEKSGKRTAKPQALPTANRVALCAKCGSNLLHTSKTGFSVGKAVLGTIGFGLAGMVGGAIGANKIKITCLECGYEMSPGNR